MNNFIYEKILLAMNSSMSYLFLLICTFCVLNINIFTEGSENALYKDPSDVSKSIEIFEVGEEQRQYIYEGVKIRCSPTKCCRMPRLCKDNGTMCAYRGIKIPAFLC